MAMEEEEERGEPRPVESRALALSFHHRRVRGLAFPDSGRSAAGEEWVEASLPKSEGSHRGSQKFNYNCPNFGTSHVSH